MPPVEPATNAPAALRPPALSGAELDRLLAATSRTFALSIPLLPEPTRREVGLAYLLFRIADTFEDAELWPRERQEAALGAFALLLGAGPDVGKVSVESWLTPPPSDHAGYLELLAATPAVLSACQQLEPEARDAILHHTVRTARGMAQFVRRKNEHGVLQLADVADLKAYCYVVAGIVGELLTELFLRSTPTLETAAVELRRRAAAFGEALQLVNILKDSAGDALHGRNFLPAATARDEVFALARTDLAHAAEYVSLLQAHGAPRGVVAFTALPVLLARASLDRVETDGPGAKLTRTEVQTLAAGLESALDRGEPAL